MFTVRVNACSGRGLDPPARPAVYRPGRLPAASAHHEKGPNLAATTAVRAVVYADQNGASDYVVEPEAESESGAFVRLADAAPVTANLDREHRGLGNENKNIRRSITAISRPPPQQR